MAWSEEKPRYRQKGLYDCDGTKMKFRYEGERDTFEVYGLEFKKGVALEVGDTIAYRKTRYKNRVKTVTDVRADFKFKGHPDFVEVKERNRGNKGTSKKSGTTGA